MKTNTNVSSKTADSIIIEHRKIMNDRLIEVLSILICLVIGIIVAIMIITPLYIALTRPNKQAVLLLYPAYIIIIAHPLVKKITTSIDRAIYWYTF